MEPVHAIRIFFRLRPSFFTSIYSSPTTRRDRQSSSFRFRIYRQPYGEKNNVTNLDCRPRFHVVLTIQHVRRPADRFFDRSFLSNFIFVCLPPLTFSPLKRVGRRVFENGTYRGGLRDSGVWTHAPPCRLELC